MNLNTLKDRATIVLVAAIIAAVFIAILFGEEALALILVAGVIGSLALQVLLLAIVADATVETLKKKKKKKKEK